MNAQRLKQDSAKNAAVCWRQRQELNQKNARWVNGDIYQANQTKIMLKLLRNFRANKAQKEYKGKLKYLFTASNGEMFYTFPSDLAQPLNRFAKVQYLLERLNSGLSGEELEKITTIMKSAIHGGLKDPKNSAQIAACVSLIEMRKGDVIHKDILLNIAAMLIIGEKEDPMIISDDYHQHKLDIFSKEIETTSPHSFFLRTSLHPLLGLTRISEQELQMLWEENLNKQKQLKQMLNNWMSMLE